MENGQKSWLSLSRRTMRSRKQFEDEFPYTLTTDQQKSLDEIKGDMEKPEIMDRLLCGDVGFGKTEVAFRCAFKAILAGKQVALLCPTTLLARQHYEVALERFANYGVKIAVFSRLVPLADQNKNLKLIEQGKIDLVIGTHRLLSKDFKFKDLGLLIVDEEQRFGVEQKERIKEMRKNIDVLTLSATPIPRTLADVFGWNSSPFSNQYRPGIPDADSDLRHPVQRGCRGRAD
jgi:transcription-repair coupling factor (superfamily II helicase)